MPLDRSPGQASQVRHDGFGTFCELVNSVSSKRAESLESP